MLKSSKSNQFNTYDRLGKKASCLSIKFNQNFHFIQYEAWGKYCNRCRGKLDFNESSGKDYGTHGLN